MRRASSRPSTTASSKHSPSTSPARRPPVLIIGENIHIIAPPVKQAIEARDAKFIQDLAVRQVEAGAGVVDLNIGPQKKLGHEVMPWIVQAVQEAVDVPLSLDTTNLAAMRAGLEVCKRPAMLNSASADPARLDSVMQLAAEFDAKVIALTMGVDGIPTTADGRAGIAMEALLPVINREMTVKIHAHRADDILTGLRLAKEFNLKVTIDHCTEGYMIADVLKERLVEQGAGIIIGPLLSERSKIELKNLSFSAPRVLEEAGVPFALMTDHPVIPIQFLPVQAGLAMRDGLSEETALRSITRYAAEIVGIADRVGTLEVGKDADIAVFDGHPFDFRTHCVLTLINGKIVHNARNREA
ncbi:MAG TPA: hypothetical protein DCY10_07290 [Clostridiales bacterium]|nr:hypothetical protein [Clostridiales bacterium]